MSLLFTSIDYCAKLYQHFGFAGSDYGVPVTTELNLPQDWNNQVSSVKVTPGYILELYDNPDRGGALLNTLTDDVNQLDPNDRASSLSCTPDSKYLKFKAKVQKVKNILTLSLPEGVAAHVPS